MSNSGGEALPEAIGEAGRILAANQTFYDAFNARDIAAMDMLWSRDSPVACLHPGWNPMTDRDEIMAAWASILANPGSPSLDFTDPEPLLFGEMALVVCTETVAGAHLACSNLFRLEGGLWRMVLHQACPIGEEPRRRRVVAQAPSPGSRRLH